MNSHRRSLISLCLMVTLFTFAIAESETLLPLSLQKTESQTFTDVSEGTDLSVKAGGSARAKLFYFGIDSVTVEAEHGGATQVFVLNDIPALQQPKANNYNSQQTIPPEFQMGIGLQLTSGATYQLTSITYTAQFVADVSLGGLLNALLPDIDVITLQNSVDFQGTSFTALGDTAFLCVGLDLQRMQLDVDIQQDSNSVSFSFAQDNVTSTEFIANDLRSVQFTAQSSNPVQVNISFGVEGVLNLSLSYVCLSSTGYPPVSRDLQFPQQAPMLAGTSRRLYQEEPLDPELLQVLSAWPSDVQWFDQNGLIPGADQDQLMVSLLNTLDRVYAEVTPQEGPLAQQPIDTEQITILSQPPSIESVTIVATPDPPVTTSVLQMIPEGWSDADGDPEGYLYRWFDQDGEIEGAESDTLDGSFFQKGNTIFAVAVPFDGATPGVAVASSPVTIQNTAPSFTELSLDVSPASSPPTETSVLTALPTGWQDIDDDPEGYRYDWFNQNGPLKGTVESTNDASIIIQGLSTFSLSLPFQLKAGQLLEIPMVGIQQGSIRLISPSGQIVGPFDLPGREGSDVTDSFPVPLDEVGDYKVEETFQLLVQSTSDFVPVEALLEQQFEWHYSNAKPAERVYNYTTSIRNLEVHADDVVWVSLNVAEPQGEVVVPFTIQEDVPANSTVSSQIQYQADFTKASNIATLNVVVTDPQVNGKYFKKGDELYVIVTANDGSADGNSIESEHVLIQNSVPRIDTVTISVPSQPATVTSVFSAMVSGWQDADKDPQQIRYQWYRQDEVIPGATSATLTEGFQRGDQISVEATPFDDSSVGASVRSAVIPVENSAPTKPAVAVSPANPLQIQDLTWRFTQPSTDADGDPLEIQVRWFIGSTEQADLAGQDIVPAERTQVGERWRISVTVSDGIVTLSPVSSAFATIGEANSPPSLESVQISPVPAFAGDVLRATPVGVQDADEDEVSVHYQWEVLRQETWTPVATGETFNTQGQVADAVVRVLATPDDGQDQGESRTDTVQLGGVVQDASGSIQIIVKRSNLLKPGVRLVAQTYAGSPDLPVANSQGYYKPADEFWQLAVEGNAQPLEQVLANSPVTVKLCNAQEPMLFLRIEANRLQSVDATFSSDCLSASTPPGGVWALGLSDVPGTPWDVNEDGSVDILDLVTVGGSMGNTLDQAITPNPDVTRDWVVDILDLVAIGSHFGESTGKSAAPVVTDRIAGTIKFENPVLDGVQVRLDIVAETTVPFLGYQIQLPNGLGGTVEYPRSQPDVFQLPERQANGTLCATRLAGESTWSGKTKLGVVRVSYLATGMVTLGDATLVSSDYERLRLKVQPFDLRQIFPEKTRLLGNFPNPFNPDTWIPFQLHQASTVRIYIYDALGREVRQWDMGLLWPGYYHTRERAIHWDGRNHAGESVASGVYFYRLQTETLSDMRRMTILK